MGGSSSKRALFWPKKKKSPLKKTWSQLKRVLPHKKRKKNALSLHKLSVKKSRKDKHSKKKPSLTANKKVPTLLKRLSMDNTKKETSQTGSPGRKDKDKGGLERVGEQIKKKLSKDEKKDITSQADTVPLSKENKANDPTSEAKVPKKKLSEIIRSIRPAANR